MTYNVGQIVTDVRNKLDDSNFSATLIKEYLNDAQREMVNRHKFKFMEATYTASLTTGTYSYSLPTAVDIVEGFRITDPSGNEVDLTNNYLTFEEFDNRFPDPDEQGTAKPHWWTIREDSFLLYPRPDNTYSLDIRYQKQPTALSDDSDVPDVPERYKELLVVGILSRCHKFNDNYDLAQVEEEKFDKLLLDVNAKNYTRQTGRPTIMKVNGWRV